jgi:H+/Cl- antiporter ClcA
LLTIPIKVLAGRMEVSNSGFWIAIGVGGAVIGTLSFSQQYSSKQVNEDIRIRSIFRDFCIGAFLTAIIYMFLPDSIDSLVSSGKSAISSAFSFSGGGSGSITTTTTTKSMNNDIELQFGPARF